MRKNLSTGTNLQVPRFQIIQYPLHLHYIQYKLIKGKKLIYLVLLNKLIGQQLISKIAPHYWYTKKKHIPIADFVLQLNIALLFVIKIHSHTQFNSKNSKSVKLCNEKRQQQNHTQNPGQNHKKKPTQKMFSQIEFCLDDLLIVICNNSYLEKHQSILKQTPIESNLNKSKSKQTKILIFLQLQLHSIQFVLRQELSNCLQKSNTIFTITNHNITSIGFHQQCQQKQTLTFKNT
eukprot:TRINITY_DN13399_c1_g1_i6.p1 TRINITY_DN13399_c1_g1~~TRINITY_DN13399_c1_g1_i6.p1  ORF type:complete len:234 (-),score=-18.27 TRINITY_DN13399_c1_g1_i6:452-1153(-)